MSIADSDGAPADGGDIDPVERAGCASDYEAAQVEGDIAGGDLDPVLAGNAGDTAGEVVRAALGDLEDAVGVAGCVRRVDGDSRFDLGEGLVCRGDRAIGGVERAGDQGQRCQRYDNGTAKGGGGSEMTGHGGSLLAGG